MNIYKKILFEKSIKIRINELPRWKPQIFIDRRTLERLERLEENSVDLEPKFSEIVDKHF